MDAVGLGLEQVGAASPLSCRVDCSEPRISLPLASRPMVGRSACGILEKGCVTCSTATIRD